MILDPIVTSQANATTSNPKDAEFKRQRLHKACVDFESVLVQQMFDSMQKTLQNGGLVGGSGVASSVYSSILSESVAKTLAEGHGMGIAKQMYQDLIKNNPGLKSDSQLKSDPQKPMESEATAVEPLVPERKFMPLHQEKSFEFKPYSESVKTLDDTKPKIKSLEDVSRVQMTPKDPPLHFSK